MAIKLDIEDLDGLLGYHEPTHSLKGMPSIPSTQPMSNLSPVKPPLAPDNTSSPAMPNLNRPEPQAPAMAAPAPTSMPSMNSSPDLKKPPGFWQKFGHGLATAGNIAGDIVAPGTMQLIPGTQLHKEYEEGRQSKLAGENARTGLEQAEAKGWAPIDFTLPGGEKITAPMRSAGGIEAGLAKTAETEGGKNTRQANAIDAKNNSPQSQASLLKLGYKMGDNGEAVPIPENELSPEQVQRRQLNDSVIRLHDAQAEVDKLKNDPNSPSFKLAQSRLEFERQAAQRQMEALGLHEQEFQNHVQEQGLLKPSGQAQSRASAAQSVLDVMPGLQQMVQKNGKEMGPIMGRLNRGEITIGNVDPEVAKLYGAMKSFYALQPAVHGFRNAEFVKDFESAIGTLERDPKAFLAGMEGLRPTLESVAKEGKTYHKRIVEGQEGGGNTPQATHVYDPATGTIKAK